MSSADGLFRRTAFTFRPSGIPAHAAASLANFTGKRPTATYLHNNEEHQRQIIYKSHWQSIGLWSNGGPPLSQHLAYKAPALPNHPSAQEFPLA
jgi:hypothetical protein